MPSDTTITKTCQTCGIAFEKTRTESMRIWVLRHKFCSKECATPPRVTKTCRICKLQFTVKAYRATTAHYCSHACAHKGRQTASPAYNAVHKWVNFHKGAPRDCEHCGNTDLKGRRYDWANVSREYKRDLDDWIRLCKSCHRAYDKKASV